jgi:hypothetical protein
MRARKRWSSDEGAALARCRTDIATVDPGLPILLIIGINQRRTPQPAMFHIALGVRWNEAFLLVKVEDGLESTQQGGNIDHECSPSARAAGDFGAQCFGDDVDQRDEVLVADPAAGVRHGSEAG